MKKTIAMLLLAGVLLTALGGAALADGGNVRSIAGLDLSGLFGSGSRLEGAGFDTAEEAVEAYITALQELDFDKAASTFAIETLAENYSLEKRVEWVAMGMSYIDYLPQGSGLAAGFNTAKRYDEVYTIICRGVLTLAGKPISGKAVPLGDTAAGDYIAETYPSQEELAETLSGMTFNGFSQVANKAQKRLSEESDQGDSARKSIQNNCTVYGCEEIKPLAASLTIDGENYYLFMDAIEYGGKWYVHGPGSSASWARADMNSGVILASELEP